MDNKELLEELKIIHTETKNIQYKIMMLFEKIENEEIIKAKGYQEKQKELINNFITENGNKLNKEKQGMLYNILRETNINKLTLSKLLNALNYKIQYHTEEGTDWKTLEIIRK